MVFEYLDYDLTGVLENKSVSLDLSQIKCLMKQLLEGIHYVHTNKVMHRDIKAANLLLNSKGAKFLHFSGSGFSCFIPRFSEDWRLGISTVMGSKFQIYNPSCYALVPCT